MRVIGVRQLKMSLSEVLRQVHEGEQVRVTVRGVPVADIVPAGRHRGDDRVRTLVGEGRIAPPARSRPARPPRLARSAQPASALVLSERDAGR